jgi:adenylate cyclase
MASLANKVGIVTGRGTGIGKATALAMARAGASLVIGNRGAAIDTLAALPTDPGYVMNEVPLLRMRALLARVHGDEITYGKFVERYRARAAACGFEGHLALAEAMT